MLGSLISIIPHVGLMQHGFRCKKWGLKIFEKVDPSMSWLFSKWSSEVANSETGAREFDDPGGAMLKPFIRRRSFCRFFFPPVPGMENESILKWFTAYIITEG